MKKARATAAYAVIQAMMWGFYAVILCYSSNFLYRWGFRDAQISLVLGLATAVSLALQVGIGELVSRVRRLKMHTVVLITAAVMLFCCAAMASGSKAAAVGGLALACVLLHTIPAMGNAMGMDAIGRGAQVSYSFARGIGSVSYSLLALVMGTLVARCGTLAVPAVAAVCALALLGGTLWFHADAERGLPELGKPQAKAEKQGNFLKKYPKFALFLVGSSLLYTSHNLLTNFMLQIISSKGGGPAEQGIATAITAFAELPVMFLFPLMERRVRCDKWVRLGAACFIIKSLGLYFAASPGGVYLAQTTQILGYGLFNISCVSYAAVVGRKETVRAQSYLASTASLGALVAASTGGVLCQWLGAGALLLCSAAFAALGGAVVLLSAQTLPLKKDRTIQ